MYPSREHYREPGFRSNAKQALLAFAISANVFVGIALPLTIVKTGVDLATHSAIDGDAAAKDIQHNIIDNKGDS